MPDTSTQPIVRPYTHVLFDLDHTLFDTEASLELAFGDAMTAVDADPADHYPTFQTINSKLWKEVEAGTVTPAVVHTRRFEQLVDALKLSGSPSDMADAFAGGLRAHGELYPGAIGLLEFLRPDTTLALITNGIGHIQRGRVERVGIEGFFETIAISSELGSAKPSPEIFAATLANLGGPSLQSTLMVGDSLSADIAGGARFGLDTCWYNPHRAQASPDSMPTYEVNSLEQLLGLFAAVN